MSWQVLITARPMNDVGQAALEQLRAAGCQVSLSPQPRARSGNELLNLLEGRDAVLADVDDFSAVVISASSTSKLKIISRWGVGYDSIDLAAATRNGVIVTNTPGLLDDAVADYTFALLLALARRIPEADKLVRDGTWRALWGHDISGKTLGVLGFGRIGRAVARRAAAFNMRVLACESTPSSSAPAEHVRFVPLDELLSESDFVSLHASLTPDNQRLIGDAQLRRMKPTAFLINTARGALIDEAALALALREKRIAGAALDAFAVEPLPADSSLRSAPNVLLTPHQASSSRETGERVSLEAARAIADLMNGHRPKHIVNESVLASPALRATIKP